MINRTLLCATSLFLLGIAAVAQDAPKPQTPPARAGQGQGRGARPVQVCAMKNEVLKTPATAESVDFEGKKVLFCCMDCKAAFEKLDDAGKTKVVKKSGLVSRKLTLQKQLEQVEKDLKALEGK